MEALKRYPPLSPPGKFLNAWWLKIIACVAMVINHTAHVFPELPQWYFILAMWIGKLTFPIMAYLLVEGYYHTRHLFRYLARLFVFSLLSVWPFAHSVGYTWNEFHWYTLGNNVLFTLFLGLLMLVLIDRFPSVPSPIWLVLFAFLSTHSDWSVTGIFLIYCFYLGRSSRGRIIWTLSLTGLFYTFSSILSALSYRNSYMGDYFAAFQNMLLTDVGPFFLGFLLCIPFLLSYNGERGPSNFFTKWSFYAFYPLHLLILILIRYLLGGPV